MRENGSQAALARSLRRHGVASAILVLLLFAGCGAWASLAEIGGAVIASGRIAVESSVKRVQHEYGGTIAEIRVREGMEVAAGDLLVRLDDTMAQAEAEIVVEQLIEALALEARLTAERDHASAITPRRDFALLAASPRARHVVADQATLMAARRTSIAGRQAQLREQIVQDERKIAGLAAQRDAKEAEIALIADELADLEGLLAKGWSRNRGSRRSDATRRVSRVSTAGSSRASPRPRRRSASAASSSCGSTRSIMPRSSRSFRRPAPLLPSWRRAGSRPWTACAASLSARLARAWCTSSPSTPSAA